MKQIVFSAHALERMRERGATEEAVPHVIHEGQCRPAKRGKRKVAGTFLFNGVSPANGMLYTHTTVEAVFA